MLGAAEMQRNCGMGEEGDKLGGAPPCTSGMIWFRVSGGIIGI